MPIYDLIQIAKVCHQANKAFCETQGDNSQVNWEDAPEWQRTSAVNGVATAIDLINKGFDEETIGRKLNESWAAEKRADGWVYGPEKDAEKKTHPCLVDYDQLPEYQRRKDFLFAATVDSLVVEL